jgi:hypothetical protein
MVCPAGQDAKPAASNSQNSNQSRHLEGLRYFTLHPNPSPHYRDVVREVRVMSNRPSFLASLAIHK